MKYDAVIFDLFGTLARGAPDEEYREFLRAMAGAIGADLNKFRAAWLTEEMRDLRAKGRLKTPGAIIEEICRRLDLSPERTAVEAAVRIRLDTERAWLEPRPDAVETLTELRRMGLKVALMSDCTAEVPILWAELPFAALFDEVLLSCELGLRKPDPKFYALACERLDVSPGRCLFVGDGASSELTGAMRAGMDAVLLAAPGHADNVLHRLDAHNWTGRRIASLNEVLQLLREPSARGE